MNQMSGIVRILRAMQKLLGIPRRITAKYQSIFGSGAGGGGADSGVRVGLFARESFL